MTNIERLSGEGKTQREIAAEVGMTHRGVGKILGNKIQSGKSTQDSTPNPSKPADSEPSVQAQLHAATLAREMGYVSINEAIADGKYSDLYPTLPISGLDPLSNEAMLPIVGQAAIDDPEAFKASTHLCAAVSSLIDLCAESPPWSRVVPVLSDHEKNILRDQLPALRGYLGALLGALS